MKSKLINAIKIFFMLGLSILIIIFMYKLEGKKSTSNESIENIKRDTIPKFFSQSINEGLWSALNYYNIYYPEIVYAQAQLETGYFKSQICINDNNLFGLYNSKTNKYYKFNHWTESVIAYKNWIQNKYRPSEDYYSFLERIHYATDSLYIRKLKSIVKRNEKR